MKTRAMRIERAVLACGVLACVAALPGCYTRVIDAKGIGADQRHPKQSEATKVVRPRELFVDTKED